ncbi:MAG: bacteriocin [Aquabacterium sp.]|nr:bacteriocin [Aquabacterium sp.]TAK99720.1 MAG: bacteriocin [Aquabacterium sp.]
MREINMNELASVTGGELCTWQGTTYSPGASVVQAYFTVKTCQENGTWK